MEIKTSELIGKLEKQSDELIIEVINAEKGGGGKTSNTYNRASALALGGLRVLVIDGDNSCNLTRSYGVKAEKTIFDLFTTLNTEIISTGKENIDIITGSPLFTDKDTKIEEENNKFLIFFMWLYQNLESLTASYDYILIDTHNDASLVTKNLIAASNLVTAVINADMHGFTAWQKLRHTINEVSKKAVGPRGEIYVTTRPYLIGNRVKTIAGAFTKTGSDFIEVASQEDGYLGIIPEKELFAKSLTVNESVFDQFDKMSPGEQKKHFNFIKSLIDLYAQINQEVGITPKKEEN